MVGPDVQAALRGVARAGFGSLPTPRTYSPQRVRNVRAFQRHVGLGEDGVIGPATWAAIAPHIDAFGWRIYAGFETVVYPQTSPHGTAGPIHPTAGLSGNWARDFMASGGTTVRAPFASKVSRLSGHDPRLGVRDGDIFGWNVYLEGASPIDGRTVEIFTTHNGTRPALGTILEPGEPFALVGHWPGDPGRSHTHLGVTHPAGKAKAVELVNAIAAAS